MSPPAKKTPAKKAAAGQPTAKAIAQLGPLAAKAAEALKDPATRDKLLENGQKVVDYVKEQRGKRPPKDSTNDDGPALRLFHQRLVRREKRVRKAIILLVGGDATLADALAPVVEALDGVVTTLAVAEALPLMSRRKAHRAIDGVLDEVEDQILAASLGLTGPADLDG